MSIENRDGQKGGSRLREHAPAARGKQGAESRNLGSTFFTIPAVGYLNREGFDSIVGSSDQSLLFH